MENEFYISVKKSLGQYFSGPKVANLLFSLTTASNIKTAIDPMCGSGDMIAAVLNGTTAGSVKITGIEIDPEICADAKETFSRNKLVSIDCHNAFNPSCISKLRKDGYDLVITNPPYVRYQSANRRVFHSSLSIHEIRNNLKTITENSTMLGQVEKHLYRTIIEHFSGLSDLAVPSWILCSLLVKEGGKIAMVLPSSWLNRDYAVIVEYLLLRLFKLEYLIEDAHSVWFDNAQVKTILLVATRIPAKTSIFDWKAETFRFAHLLSGAATDESLTGKLTGFLKLVENNVTVKNSLETSEIRLIDQAERLKAHVEKKKWFALLEPKSTHVKSTSFVHKELSRLKKWASGSKATFDTLEAQAAEVGQGLRTGANNFFYVTCITKRGKETLVVPDKSFGLRELLIPNGFLQPVIRKQTELDSSFSTKEMKVNGAVLHIQHHATPKDIETLKKVAPELKKHYHLLPETVVVYIEIAAKTSKKGSEQEKIIPELSAVKTNVRLYNDRFPGILPRFWYMLPSFTKRHCPDLFLPRVNGSRVITRLNSQKSLIDANFSTIWLKDEKNGYDHYSLLALLNSTYAVTAMEEYGTVMGGGALKLEATQLKRIPFPILTQYAITELSELGKQLAHAKKDTDKIIFEIDQIILKDMNFKEPEMTKLNELRLLHSELLAKRN